MPDPKPEGGGGLAEIDRGRAGKSGVRVLPSRSRQINRPGIT